MKYEALYQHLLSLEEGEVLQIRLNEFEQRFQIHLPQSAYNHSHAFFANSAKNIYACTWMDAGFLAAYDSQNQSVTFSRGEYTPREARNARAEPTQRDSCILLNKSFTGEWLQRHENNIAHEIINFFKADDGNVYIYNAPYGANVSNAENMDIKYLFLTTAKPHGVYFLEYCIEIERSLHYRTLGHSVIEEQGAEIVADGIQDIEATINKSIREITYGGVRVEDLFDDEITVFPCTYLARRVYRAIHPIPIEESEIPAETNGNKPYIYARNFGSVLQSKNPSTFDYLMQHSPERSEEAWEEIELERFAMLDVNDELNRRKLRCLDQNLFLDLIDNYKMEECYTKILIQLMRSEPDFINYLIHETLDMTVGERFVPSDEVAIKDFGRIDIYAESENHILILENKIDSGFTMKNNVSQLKRYWEWASTEPGKSNKTQIRMVIAPDYRIAAVESEELHLRQKEGFEEYVVVPYSKVEAAIREFHDQGGWTNFKFAQYMDAIQLLFLRMSLAKKDLYTTKITKHILANR